MDSVPASAPHAGTLLACVPPSGAGRSFFQQWPRRIGADALLVRSRAGHEERMREPLHRSVEAAADDVAAAVRARAPRRAVVFGHSLGAVIAFEAVRRLEGGSADLVLVVSARQAPQLPAERLAGLGESDAELLAAIAAWGGPRVDPDSPVGALLAASLRADFALSAAYRWDGGGTAVPVLALAYADDRVVEPAAVAGWRAAALGGFAQHVLPGDHYAARQPSDRLAALIRDTLAAGGGESTAGRGPSPTPRSA